MNWSLKLGKVAGIGIYVHWTFSLLLAWVLIAHLAAGEGLAVALAGVALILALFGCVVLHELGHALTARRFGVVTADITLLPIGGVARLKSIPEDPTQELLIALAGPAVNVVIAAVLVALLVAVGGFVPVTQLSLVGGSFVAKLLWINVVLAAFNLLPAFPMDGGRVLRALLAYRLSYGRATQIAAHVGQAMAIGFGLLSIVSGNLLLAIIALFIFLAGGAEAAVARMKDAVRGVPVREAMSTDYHTLQAHDSLDEAVQLVLHGYRGDFPVTADVHLVGLLRQRDVVMAILRHETESFVTDWMCYDCPTVTAGESLSRAIEQMHARECESAVVDDGAGAVIGVLSLEHLGHWVTLHEVNDGTNQIEGKVAVKRPARREWSESRPLAKAM